MYDGGKGGGSLTAVVPTTAGVAVLPNTGGNPVLFVAALLSTIIGGAILLSTVARFVVAKTHKA